MPFKTCQSGGKSGTKYGDSGKCYTGDSAKKKAIQQAKAIYWRRSQKDKKGKV